MFEAIKQAYLSLIPPKPTLTEQNLEDQTGKVFLITGATSGCGEELARILYQHNAKVYVAARSSDKAIKAIDGIKKAFPDSKGQLVYLHLDLSNLSTIKASATEFTSSESKLDVLWLNAGVMIPPQGSTTAQGHELQLGTNVVGHHLLVKYLEPILKKTASAAPSGSVRVVWVSSSAALLAPKPPINFENVDYKKKDEAAWTKYNRSKAANVIQANELGRRLRDSGIVTLSLNPGNLKTELQRNVPVIRLFFINLLLYEAKYGAYTELFAGLSKQITLDHTGGWIQPWGRLVKGRADLEDPQLGKKFIEWCDEQVKDYYH